MRLWRTHIKALNPVTGEYGIFSGPVVPGLTIRDAFLYCINNNLGYCLPIGLHKEEKELIPSNPAISQAVGYNVNLN